jgi:hypothetical protein
MKKLTLLITLFLFLSNTGIPQASVRITRLLAEADSLIAGNHLQEALVKPKRPYRYRPAIKWRNNTGLIFIT